MEIRQDFSKGLALDFVGSETIPGTYENAINITRDITGKVRTEKPFVDSVSIPEGETVAGDAYLNGRNFIVTRLDTGIRIYEYKHIEGNNILGELTKVGELLTIKLNSGYTKFIVKATYTGQPTFYFLDYYNVPRVHYLGKTYNSEEEETRLFVTAAPTVTELEAVTEGGSIPSGIYMIGARYVTDTGNSSNFGAFTSPIPIFKGSGVGRGVTGDLPQTKTNKRITATISGVSSVYKYIQPVVFTYIGDSNVPKMTALNKVEIKGSSVTIEYTAQETDSESIPVEEILGGGVNYKTAKTIGTKDNILFLGNLSTSEDIEHSKWQNIANSISVKWVKYKKSITDTFSFSGELLDYDSDYTVPTGIARTGGDAFNGENNVLETGIHEGIYKNPIDCARRVGYRRGEVYSFGFTPIVGGVALNTYHIPAIGTNQNALADGTLGVAETSGIGLKYPDYFGALSGNTIKYHRMPTESVCPVIDSSSANGILVINILGLNFTVVIPEEISSQMDGYTITRESRKGKETILSQGIGQHFWTIEDDSKDKFHTPVPGGLSVNYTVRDGSSTRVNKKETDVNRSLLGILTPEPYIFTDMQRDASILERVAVYTAKYKLTNAGRYEDIPLMNLLDVSSTSGNLNDSETVEVLGSADIPANTSSAFINGLGEPIKSGTGSGPLMCFKTNGNFPTSYIGSTIEFVHDIDSGDTDIVKLWDDSIPVDVYNLKTSRPGYYGAISSKEYLPITTVLFGTARIDPLTDIRTSDSTSINVFGGDTFINKVGIFSKTSIYRFYWNTNEARTPELISRNLYYLPLESNVNYDLQYFKQINAEGGIEGTLPLYPNFTQMLSKTDPFGLFNYSGELGHPTAYNKQYSAQNVIEPKFTPTEDIESVSTFGTRIIYSDVQNSGSSVDSYRNFLVNNYTDLNVSRGDITNIFSTNNTLYAHTADTLWRCFVNDAVIQSSSLGEVYLGNGGLFNRPALEMATSKGSYTGCIDHSHSVSTPFGYFFIDKKNGSILKLTDSLVPLGADTCKYSLSRLLKENSNLFIGYSTGNNTLHISNDNWTLSYDEKLNSFSSFHTYRPKSIINVGNDTLYLINNKYLIKTDELYQSALRSINGDSNITFSLNIQTSNSNMENYEFLNTRFKLNNYKVPSIHKVNTNKVKLKNFRFFNTYKDTGILIPNIVTSFIDTVFQNDILNINKIQDHYRLAIPVDRKEEDGSIDYLGQFKAKMTGSFITTSIDFENDKESFSTLEDYKTDVVLNTY